MHVTGNFFAGSLAGTTALLFTYPLDLIRARLAAQVNVKYYSGIWNAIQTIFKENGIAGLSRGIMPSLWVSINILQSINHNDQLICYYSIY